jgi:UDP-glucose 4-epimerase
MKIYITGIAGFLGSHLAKRMLFLGHQVGGNDSMIGGEKDNLPDGIKFDLTDCCDYDRMLENTKGYDIVYHCAATAHEGLSVFSPNFITKNIYQASVATITAAIQNKVKRFVYCSSMARYGHQKTPFTEDMKPEPVDPYGIAKVAGEETLKLLSEIHGMEYNIAVPHNIVGPNQKYDDPYRNVMSIIINRNLQGKPAIIYGDGEQSRCFSYIDDVIYCLEKLALNESIKGETINVNFDLSTIQTKEVDFSIFKNKNEFDYTTPSGTKLTFKILTHGDERLIDKDVEALKKINKDVSSEISTRLRYMIKSVDGKNDLATINKFVNNMLAKDSRALREHIKSMSPDMNMKFEYTHEDGEVEEAPIALGVGFFWPSYQS